MSLKNLVAISRKYGADPDYVIAGGGNTSYKDEKTLYIKGSGTSLASIGAEDFVRMDRSSLRTIWQKQYPPDVATREQFVLQDLMAARFAGEEQKRPSVETMLHDLLPFAYVVHTHPALVNGLTCSRKGVAAVQDLFGADALWIPITNPGYILALRVQKALEEYKGHYKKPAQVVFLQNHGVFVAADSPEAIDGLYKKISGIISQRITRVPDLKPIQTEYGPSKAIAEFLLELQIPSGKDTTWAIPKFVHFRRDKELAYRTQGRTAFEPLLLPFTPDHIVYAGSNPLFLDLQLSEPSVLTNEIKQHMASQWKSHLETFNRVPKIVAVSKLGIFGFGTTKRAAELATELMADAAKVACYTESFGGPRPMEQEFIDFINNWEVEQYRSKISTK